MTPEQYQWVTIGLGACGFVGTWVLGAFRLGRAVEQMKSGVKQDIEDEKDKILNEMKAIEKQFSDEQRVQDHNFGEVGAAMRQYIADVEKKVREVEIYGRDNYVKIPDFERAVERLSADFKTAVSEIRDDIRDLLKTKPS